MKQYFKPIFRIAAWAPNPGQKISCTTSQEDLELICSILGITVEELGGDNTFSTNEECVKAFPIDMYCKFTAVANGAEAAFLS